ncbi:hypothetical protein [Sorangium sp. So ce1024]|uniref:hypothetical protein n=1 Tax=Sorangium sp. So ce1024 TaxID=3133327 RepID=UPI003F025C30
MITWFRRSTHVLAVLGLLSASLPAAAQDIAAAEALFDRGLADMQAGRYETGCKALAESQRIDPQPGTLFTLAACESEWGRIATAVTRFGDYLSLVQRMTPAEVGRQGERPKIARQKREQLSPRVPKLAISLPPGAPAGTVVKRNDLELGEATLGIALPVDPGEHLVSIQVPGRPIRTQHITIAPGETKELTLELKETPPPQVHRPSKEPAPEQKEALAPRAPAPSPAPAPTIAPEIGPEPAPAEPDAPAPPSGRRTAVYMTGGVGAAGLVLGGITGALVFGKKSTIEDHCGSGIQVADPKVCDPTGYRAATSASAMARVSTIAFGVALAGLGAAAVLYWTEPKHADTAAGSSPRWVSAGVLEAGPAGAVFGAQGGF